MYVHVYEEFVRVLLLCFHVCCPTATSGELRPDCLMGALPRDCRGAGLRKTASWLSLTPTLTSIYTVLSPLCSGQVWGLMPAWGRAADGPVPYRLSWLPLVNLSEAAGESVEDATRRVPSVKLWPLYVDEVKVSSGLESRRQYV